jgi:hypothetical protein
LIVKAEALTKRLQRDPDDPVGLAGPNGVVVEGDLNTLELACPFCGHRYSKS